MPARPVVLWHADLWWAAERRLTESSSRCWRPSTSGSSSSARVRGGAAAGARVAGHRGREGVRQRARRRRHAHTRGAARPPGGAAAARRAGRRRPGVPGRREQRHLRLAVPGAARDPGPVGRVAWGAGNAFASSVLWLRADPPVRSATSATSTSRACAYPPGRRSSPSRRVCRPCVQPPASTRRCLDHGRPGSAREVLADRARDAVAWLAEEHRDRAQALLVSEGRLAQEAVGRDVLEATDGWRDGLGP